MSTPLGRNYWKLWTASVISNLGDGVSFIAYPWLASAVTRDPVQIALVAVATRLPWLIFTLPAGVITDRVDRRKLVAWMDVVRFVITLGVAFTVFAAQGQLASPDEIAAGTAPSPANSTLLLVAIYAAAPAARNRRSAQGQFGADAFARHRGRGEPREGQRTALGRRVGDELVRGPASGRVPARHRLLPALFHRRRLVRSRRGV